MNSKSTIPELSQDSRALADALMAVASGVVVEYAHLTAVIGRDVRTQGRHVLESARRIALRKGAVFEAVVGVGLRRLDNEGLAKAAPGYTRRVHRCAKRGASKLVCANLDDLTAEGKTRLLTNLSVMGAVAQVTRPRRVEALASSANTSGKALPVGQTLALFSKRKPKS